MNFEAFQESEKATTILKLTAAYTQILLALIEIDKWTSLNTLYPHWNWATYRVHYPYQASSGKCLTTGMQAWSDRDLCVVQNAEDNNFVITHEFGHALMWRAIASASLGNCVSGSGWSQFLSRERCATSEGWADFFASAIHFGPTATAPIYQKDGITGRLLEGPLAQTSDNGYSGGSGTASCVGGVDQHRLRGNVARYFWDIYDNTTIDDMGLWGGIPYNSDLLTSPTLANMVSVWTQFPSGSADRARDESGVHGRNIWDFNYHMMNLYSYDSASIALRNCVYAQEAN